MREQGIKMKYCMIIVYILLIIKCSYNRDPLKIIINEIKLVKNKCNIDFTVENIGDSKILLTNINENQLYSIKDDLIELHYYVFKIPEYIRIDAPFGPKTKIIYPHSIYQIKNAFHVSYKKYFPFDIINFDTDSMGFSKIDRIKITVGYIVLDKQKLAYYLKLKDTNNEDDLRERYNFLLTNQLTLVVDGKIGK
jgi:hypothetical protein